MVLDVFTNEGAVQVVFDIWYWNIVVRRRILHQSYDPKDRGGHSDVLRGIYLIRIVSEPETLLGSV